MYTNYVAKFFLFITPICYQQGIDFDNFALKMLQLAFACLLGVSFLDDNIRRIPGKFVTGGLIGVCLFNIFLHGFNDTVCYTALNIFLSVGCFSLIVQNLKNPEECYKYIVYAGLVNIFIFCLQKQGVNLLPFMIPREFPGGMLLTLPRFATYLALITPFFINVSWVFAVPLFLITVWGYKQLIVFGSLGIAALFLCCRLKKYRIYAFIVFVELIILALVHFHGNIFESFRVRFCNWGTILARYFVNPLKGIGLGLYPFDPEKGTVIHNSFLQFACYSGILGFWWVGYAFKFVKDHIDLSFESMAILCLIMTGLIEYVYGITSLRFTMISIVAFFVIRIIKNKEKAIICQSQL